MSVHCSAQRVSGSEAQMNAPPSQSCDTWSEPARPPGLTERGEGPVAPPPPPVPPPPPPPLVWPALRP